MYILFLVFKNTEKKTSWKDSYIHGQWPFPPIADKIIAKIVPCPTLGYKDVCFLSSSSIRIIESGDSEFRACFLTKFPLCRFKFALIRSAVSAIYWNPSSLSPIRSKSACYRSPCWTVPHSRGLQQFRAYVTAVYLNERRFRRIVTGYTFRIISPVTFVYYFARYHIMYIRNPTMWVQSTSLISTSNTSPWTMKHASRFLLLV